ncbi:MAG: prolipoprotein diacylglyceryl transferase [Rikenellaceae bacterium]
MLTALFIEWEFNPVLVEIGGFEIRYYGLMWALTIFLAAKMFDTFCRREGLAQSISESFFVYGTLGTILGSRIGHCIFYEPERYLVRPWEIITAIREGGMASHGAAIGLLVGIWLFSRRNKMPYVWGLDRVMIPVGLGGALIRLGNLFNSEIYGAATDLPWAFKFYHWAKRPIMEGTQVVGHEWVTTSASLPSHPTQLYEAAFYMMSFFVLCWMYRRKMGEKYPGMMLGVGLIFTFFTRIIIEFIKNDQEAFEQDMMLNMGQWLSIPFVIGAICLIWYSAKHPVEQSLKQPSNKKCK